MNSRNIRCIDINPYEQLQNLQVSPENDNRVQHWVHQLSLHQPTSQRKHTHSTRPPSTTFACDKENLAPEAHATIRSTPDAFHAFSFDPQASDPLHSAKDHQRTLYQSRPSRKRKQCPSHDHEPGELRRSTRIRRKGPIATMAPRGRGKGTAAHPASKNQESEAKYERHGIGQGQERAEFRVGQPGRVTRASQDAGRGTTGKEGNLAKSEQSLQSDKSFE